MGLFGRISRAPLPHSTGIGGIRERAVNETLFFSLTSRPGCCFSGDSTCHDASTADIHTHRFNPFFTLSIFRIFDSGQTPLRLDTYTPAALLGLTGFMGSPSVQVQTRVPFFGGLPTRQKQCEREGVRYTKCSVLDAAFLVQETLELLPEKELGDMPLGCVCMRFPCLSPLSARCSKRRRQIQERLEPAKRLSADQASKMRDQESKKRLSADCTQTRCRKKKIRASHGLIDLQSWMSCLLTSSLSLGISSLFCRATQCM
jgi:hypothetical protein